MARPRQRAALVGFLAWFLVVPPLVPLSPASAGTQAPAAANGPWLECLQYSPHPESSWLTEARWRLYNPTEHLLYFWATRDTTGAVAGPYSLPEALVEGEWVAMAWFCESGVPTASLEPGSSIEFSAVLSYKFSDTARLRVGLYFEDPATGATGGVPVLSEPIVRPVDE